MLKNLFTDQKSKTDFGISFEMVYTAKLLQKFVCIYNFV